jgi:hypothetical protein
VTASKTGWATGRVQRPGGGGLDNLVCDYLPNLALLEIVWMFRDPQCAGQLLPTIVIYFTVSCTVTSRLLHGYFTHRQRHNAHVCGMCWRIRTSIHAARQRRYPPVTATTATAATTNEGNDGCGRNFGSHREPESISTGCSISHVQTIFFGFDREPLPPRSNDLKNGLDFALEPGLGYFGLARIPARAVEVLD